MVIFALSHGGFKELEPIISSRNYPLWVCAGVLSKEEIENIRSLGIEVTEFNYNIELSDMTGIRDALGTIAEHHPGKRVWVEVQPST